MADDILHLVTSITDVEKNLLASQIVEGLRALGQELRPKPDSLAVRLAIPFSASLAGALSAFSLNWLKEARKTESDRNNVVTESIILLTSNLNILVNYKVQFLTAFESELRTLREHAAQYGSRVSPDRIQQLAHEWRTVHKPAINRLFLQYENHPTHSALNGLLRQHWERPKFAEINAERLGFTAKDSPNTIRFVVGSAARMENFLEVLEERNLAWKSGERILSGDELFEPTGQFMLILFRFIDYRETLARYADEALVLLYASALLLMLFQRQSFPKRKALGSLIFGNNKWVNYSVPPEISSVIPGPRTGPPDAIGSLPRQWWGNAYDTLVKHWFDPSPGGMK